MQHKKATPAKVFPVKPTILGINADRIHDWGVTRQIEVSGHRINLSECCVGTDQLIRSRASGECGVLTEITSISVFALE